MLKDSLSFAVIEVLSSHCPRRSQQIAWLWGREKRGLLFSLHFPLVRLFGLKGSYSVHLHWSRAQSITVMQTGSLANPILWYAYQAGAWLCLPCWCLGLHIQDVCLKDVAGDSRRKRKSTHCLQGHFATFHSKLFWIAFVTKAFHYHKMLVMADVSQTTCLSSLAILSPI